MMEKAANGTKIILKNKKAIKRTISIVAVIVLAIITVSTIYKNRMEKISLEQIEEHIRNEEYEFAFDKVNSGYISDEYIVKYREIVVPHMQEAFTITKKSERESLSLVIAGEEYYIYDGWDADEIYTKQADDRTVLYKTPEDNMDYVGGSYASWSYHLDANLSMYANNSIFFMERCYGSTLSSAGLDGDDLYVALKYLDLSTGVVKEIGSDEDFRWMYKLEDGSIFVQYTYRDMSNGGKRNPCGGIRYNPYTQTLHKGENVVTEEELENAVYRCKES